MLAMVLAWTQLFGLLTFELFGQTNGLVTDHQKFFTDAASEMAARIGLQPTQPRVSFPITISTRTLCDVSRATRRAPRLTPRPGRVAGTLALASEDGPLRRHARADL
jgi:hypothetical protein